MEMRKETEESFRNVIDTFIKLDGGGRFFRIKIFIEDIDKRAKNGDMDAQKIIDVVHQFSDLVNVANKIKYDGGENSDKKD